MREAIELMADSDSFLELRQAYGLGMITGIVRIEGRPFGLIANNPNHLGGAIDAEAAEKAARFLQLCDGFDVPVLSLCDTPGFMVGPDNEKHATVRRASSLMVVGASLSVPVFMVCMRKGYGLGAQAMAMGSFHVPQMTIAWPTGEFGPMGLEGAVRLGYSKELAAAASPEEEEALFNKLVDAMYENGKALNVAMYHEIDAVIDPKETRDWIIRGLKSMPVGKKGGRGKRPFIDTW
jgi:acetyl-CoA carboxylase carboxyltransferase component